MRRVRHRGAAGRRRGQRRRGGQARRFDGFPGRDEDRVARHPAQDRGRRRARGREERRRRGEGLRQHCRERQEVQGRRADPRRSGAADAEGRPGGHRRRRHRRQLRQAGRVRPRGRAGRSAEGHHLPPGPCDEGRRVLDARRHPGRRNAEGRARQRTGRSRRARQPDRRRERIGQRLPGNLRARPEPGIRVERQRDRCRRAHRRRLRRQEAALPPRGSRRAEVDESHHAAEVGGGDRRIVRRRQDRQLGDEEPDQRGLQGQHLPDPSEGRGDPRLQGIQERQGCSGRDRHCGVRDPRQVRRRRARRVRREEDRRRRADPVGLRRNRPARDAGRARHDRPQVQHPHDGAEHLRLLLHAGQPVRHLLHRVRRQRQRRAVVAIGRHRHGDHRLQPLRQDGCFGDRRPGQQVGHRRRRPADLLRAGSQHESDRAALRRPEGRSRVRRSGAAAFRRRSR